MLFISRDEKRDIQQEFNSRSISLASKIVDMTTFVATLSMETAGVEPASRNSNTSASTRVVCLFTIHVTLCRQTGVLYANLEISCR